MSEIFVWLLSTTAFWFLANSASNTIEATVHHYSTRVVVMAATGIAIGALASAVGYGFFILTLLLIIQFWFLRHKLTTAMGGDRSAAAKYALPAFLLVISATVASYLFSIEACDRTGHECKRVFFDRIYTPPHLKPPTGISIKELDAAVRGQTSSETWNRLPPKFKHLQCLEYKVSSMRQLVSTVSRVAELLEYYPRWVEGLTECGRQYSIDEEKAGQLREAIATKMAQVLGEEVSSYLTLQRLYSSEPRDNWLGKWRSFAIVGIAGVSEVLPKNP